MKYLLTLLLLLTLLNAAPTEDQVHIAIPGYTQHRWYSGYLNFSTGNFHYVFFNSQRDPDNDPLVLWLNGGPGCSSLIGMTQQNGPFVFKQNSTSLLINPYSWNMKANVLYISSPGGVGFSIDKRNLTNDDGTTAIDNYKALLEFFIKFPNLKKNDFYITGESYAGIYVPYLAYYIIQQNKLPNREITINLKGIMVGNACTDPRECYEPGNDINLGIYQYENLYNHGFYTEDQFNDIKSACWLGYFNDQCIKIRETMDKKYYATRTSMLNLYAKCMNQRITFYGDKKAVRKSNGRLLPLKDDSIECQDVIGIHTYFNDPMTQSKLHVKFMKFEMCSDAVAQKYKMFANASYWLYPLLIKQQLRVWVFSGDVDNSVPIVGTLKWIPRMREEFGLPIIQPWRQWWVPGLHKHEDQVGGMTWKLRGFTFASVKGAGHLVPRDKRQAASVLFNSFINNVDLPYKSP